MIAVIPLKMANLCESCQVIFSFGQICPACGSSMAVLPLTKFVPEIKEEHKCINADRAGRKSPG